MKPNTEKNIKENNNIEEKNRTAEEGHTTLEKRRKLTSANYTMAMTALVLAFVIIVNLLVGSLSENVRTLDFTKGDIFTLTEDTENLLERIDKDVTIYLILEDITQRNDDLYKLLKVYDDASSHVSIEIVNPASNPTFMENREYVSNGSIIVESGERFRGVELSTMYIGVDDEYTGSVTYFYDMEGQITSAIDYVTRDDIPKAYFLKSASGERDVFDKSIVTEIEKQNIDIDQVTISEEQPIPEDADILILDQPVADISNLEYELINDFMDKGGSLIMFEYYNVAEGTDMSNIEKLMYKYGISVEYGAAIETNTNFMWDRKAYYGKPIIEKHKITEDLEDENLIVVMGDAINIHDVDDRITIEPILTSTPSAYYKDRKFKDSSNSSSMAQLASDPVGTFNYAVAVTDDISSELQSRFVYISSFAFAKAEQYESLVGTGNTRFVVKCLQWLAGQEETVSVPMRSRTYATLVYTVVAKQRIFYIIVAAVPAIVLAYGGYVWFKRRRR